MVQFHAYSKERIQKAARRGGGHAGRPRRKVTDDYMRLARLSNSREKLVQTAFAKGLNKFKRRINVDLIAELWAKGDYHKVWAAIPFDKIPDDLDDAMAEIIGVLEGAIELTLARASKLLKIPIEKAKANKNTFQKLKDEITVERNPDVNLRFDVTNPQIRGYLTTLRTERAIKYVSDDVKKVVQGYITRTFTEGLSPRQVAENLKSSIGLLPQHEIALQKYKDGLRAGGASLAKVKNLGDKYEEKLLDYRTGMIAKTEVRLATNFGQLSVWKEMATQGSVDKDRAQKEWVVDGAPCDVCADMDGIRVGLYETWLLEYDDGTTLAVDIPTESHPHCMCGMEIVFNDEGDEES